MKRCRGACRRERPNEDFPYRGAAGTKYRDSICCECGPKENIPQARHETRVKRNDMLEFRAVMMGMHAARRRSG